MIEPDQLTRDTFKEELLERLDALRSRGVEVPSGVSDSVDDLVAARTDAFSDDVFRLSVSHVLSGLAPSMALADHGSEVLAERVRALPANLRACLELAAEHREQSV